MILYSAVIPTYHKGDKGDEKAGSDEEVINAEDPANRAKVRQFFEDID